MKVSRRFTQSDSVVDLVEADYNILPLLSRFSLPLGFGDKTIGRTCDEANIDVDVFLLVINHIITRQLPDLIQIEKLRPMAIVDFLRKSHGYFVDYKFPEIRTKLLRALEESHNDINPIIVRFFDDFIRHIHHHFDYEENIIFPYIEAVASGKHTEYDISIFRKQHDDVGDTLRELKNIILRYYSTAKPDLMYDVLVDIYNVEADLDSHADIENNIMVPRIEFLEKQLLKDK